MQRIVSVQSSFRAHALIQKGRWYFVKLSGRQWPLRGGVPAHTTGRTCCWLGDSHIWILHYSLFSCIFYKFIIVTFFSLNHDPFGTLPSLYLNLSHQSVMRKTRNLFCIIKSQYHSYKCIGRLKNPLNQLNNSDERIANAICVVTKNYLGCTCWCSMAIRVVEFSNRGYKIRNLNTHRKLLNFENWVNREVSKIGHHFRK